MRKDYYNRINHKNLVGYKKERDGVNYLCNKFNSLPINQQELYNSLYKDLDKATETEPTNQKQLDSNIEMINKAVDNLFEKIEDEKIKITSTLKNFLEYAIKDIDFLYYDNDKGDTVYYDSAVNKFNDKYEKWLHTQENIQQKQKQNKPQ